MKNGVEEEIMKDVLVLENRGDHLFLADLLGNEKKVRGKIKHIDFGNHKVILE
jgi:predicted RNA-binding protein